VICHPFGKT